MSERTFDPRDTANRASLSVREVAERFIELFHHQDNPVDAFTCWVHPDYIQHNPNAPTGRDATMAFLGNAGLEDQNIPLVFFVSAGSGTSCITSQCSTT